MRYLFFLIVLVVLADCADKQKIPAGILGQSKMTSVLSDMLIVDAVTNEKKSHDTSINIKSLTPLYYQEVFALHKISKDVFFKSYNYYLSHPDMLKVILDSAYTSTSKKVISSYPKSFKKNPKS